MKTTCVSMMNCFKVSHLIGILVFALFAVSCSADVDTELGYDIIPDHQKMEMRHLTFKGGKVISFNASASTDDQSKYIEREGKFFRTSLYHTDSLLSSNVSNGYLGVEHSDTFGMRSAALASGNTVTDSLYHFFAELCFRSVKTRCIGENQLGFIFGKHAHNPCSCSLRLIGNYSNFLS